MKRNCLPFVVLVVGLGAWAVGGGTSRADGVPATAPAAKGVDLIQRLKHFNKLSRGSEVYEEDKVLAKPLLAALQKAMAENKDDRAVFNFYAARCLLKLDDRPGAKALLKEAAADEHNVNRAEAMLWLENIANWFGGAESDTIEARVQRYERLVASFFPDGEAADYLRRTARADRGEDLVIRREPFHPEHNFQSPFLAAQLYHEMNRFEDARRLCWLSVGLHYDDDWFNEVVASVWMEIGECHRGMGQWKQARAYYFKAVAAGEPIKEPLARIREMEQNLQADKKITPPAPKDNAETLDRIARRCAEADLFIEARRAAEAANRARATPEFKVLAEILEQQAEVHQKLLDSYGSGITFRGEVIDAKAIAQAKAKAREYREHK